MINSTSSKATTRFIGTAILAGVAVVWLMGASQASNQQPASTPPPSKPQNFGDRIPPEVMVQFSGCMAADCHPGKKEFPLLHGPMYIDACDTCHVLTDSKLHLYELIREPDKLCVFCHETPFPTDSMIHEPYKTGTCLPCHNPHGGEGPGLLKSEHYADLCLTCHEDFIGSRNLIHGPVEAGACATCHQPHVSKGRKLLESDGRDMCLRCHVSLDIEIESARVVHQPVLDDCQLCHNPHATDNASLLLEKPVDLCVGCHADIHQTIDNASTPHGAMLTERACLNCHSPHASDHTRLLKDNIDALCFECHNKEIEREDGTKLANIKKIIESGTSLHGPVASGNCTACHDIHGGKNSRLLVRAYSKDLYASFDEGLYALCFGCHDKAIVIDKRSTTVTEFRNGDTNLHFVHVNRDQKGRSCSICHDSHAADRDQHIHDTVPFGPGGWELPIHFQRIEGGGTCASGCHKSLEYNRTNPVIYPPKTEKDSGEE